MGRVERGVWTTAFVLLFGLSLDYWRWDGEVTLGVLGLPEWMYWLVVLQVVLAAMLWIFGSRRPEDGGDGETDG